MINLLEIINNNNKLNNLIINNNILMNKIKYLKKFKKDNYYSLIMKLDLNILIVKHYHKFNKIK